VSPHAQWPTAIAAIFAVAAFLPRVSLALAIVASC
jgi:hypothetical protein